MNHSPEIDTEADAVRRSIAASLDTGSSALAEFSRRYARTPGHKNAARAIRVNIHSIEDQATVERLRHQMNELLDGILQEHENNDPDASSDLEARRRLFTKFRKEPVKLETVCRLTRLEKRFARSGFAVGPISCDFRAGEITALVGENANGKTTLLRTIVGEYGASNGQISFPALSSGTNWRWGDVSQKIGYLPQQLLPRIGSLRDALYFRAALRGLTPPESETQVDYLIARLGLGEHITKTWWRLSGGFQLKFALAEALAGKPKFLVLDEPLANLDPKAQAALLSDIRDLAKSAVAPMAVIISSQVLYPLEAISDNLIFLRNGSVVYNGRTREIGLDRIFNLYECDAAISLSALSDRIGEHVEDITYNGVYFIIKAPLSLSFSGFLEILKRENIEFEHVRDISQKIASLFEVGK
jgi:ABC-2 type transport system ATP-binding protein